MRSSSWGSSAPPLVTGGASPRLAFALSMVFACAGPLALANGLSAQGPAPRNAPSRAEAGAAVGAGLTRPPQTPGQAGDFLTRLGEEELRVAGARPNAERLKKESDEAVAALGEAADALRSAKADPDADELEAEIRLAREEARLRKSCAGEPSFLLGTYLLFAGMQVAAEGRVESQVAQGALPDAVLGVQMGQEGVKMLTAALAVIRDDAAPHLARLTARARAAGADAVVTKLAELEADLNAADRVRDIRKRAALLDRLAGGAEKPGGAAAPPEPKVDLSFLAPGVRETLAARSIRLTAAQGMQVDEISLSLRKEYGPEVPESRFAEVAERFGRKVSEILTPEQLALLDAPGRPVERGGETAPARVAPEDKHLTQCASNLRQIGLALMIHATDHEDRLPADLGALRPIGEHLPASVFLCPLSGKKAPADFTQWDPARRAQWVNANTDYAFPAAGRKNVLAPTLVLAHEKGHHPRGPADSGVGRGGWVLFGDGHTEFKKAAEVGPAAPPAN